MLESRWGDFSKVLEGIDAAQKTGLKIKLNAVALKGSTRTRFPTCCVSRMAAAWT